MNDSEFNQIVDETLLKIEDAVENSGADIDYDTVAGILTLEFANGTKIIINRQGANQELWVAAKSGGYHLRYADDVWHCQTTQEDLQFLLGRVCSEQAGESVEMEI